MNREIFKDKYSLLIRGLLVFAAALISSAKDTIVPISEKYGLAYQLEDESKLDLSDKDYADVYSAMETAMKDYDLKNVPIYFVHAEHDQICTRYASTMLYDILKDMGCKNNKIKIYSDDEMEAAGQHMVYHASWALAFEDKDILDWVYA